MRFTKIEGEGPAKGWVPYYVKGQRVAKRTTKYPWFVAKLQKGAIVLPYIVNSLEFHKLHTSKPDQIEAYSTARTEGEKEKEEFDEDSMWQKILELDQGNFPLSTSVVLEMLG